MNKFMKQIKEYGGLGFLITAALISAAISYGSTQATASITFADHEKRIMSVESDDKDFGKEISAMKVDIINTKREVHDLWLDNGHRDNR